ncbi:sulfatase-like hydrolase/transferase [Acuticoccus sediminis]|nr:sulfatase-like hydrolase/transferase [Acuticoccus sediminis]
MKDLVVIAADELFNVWNYKEQFGVPLHTPNLDRLGAMGTSFTNAQVTTPLCSPSRAAALTGQSAFATGQSIGAGSPRWSEEIDLTKTLPAVLNAAGYESYGFGKVFHEFQPSQAVRTLSFDHYYSPPEYAYRPPADGQYGVGVFEGPEARLGDVITTRAAADVLTSYDEAAPLSLMIGLSDPHGPMISPQSYRDFYPLDQIVAPEWTGDEVPPWMQEYSRTELWPTIRNDGWAERYIQGYLANVSEMDARLGTILDAIDASDRDPVIAFWCDHGFMLGNHDLDGKFAPYEQATSTPLIFVDPDAGPRGVRNDGVVSLLDLMPTVLDLVGVPVPDTVEGNSLAGVVHDPGVPTEGVALTAIMGTISMRTPAYRITRYEDNTYELFDCRRDPENQHNLVDVPRYGAVLEKLQHWLQAEAEQQGVTFFDHQKVVRFDTDWGQQYFFSANASNILAISDPGGYDRGHSNNALVRMPDWMEDFWFKPSSDPDANATTIIGNGLDNQIFSAGAGGADRGGDDTLKGAGGADYIVAGPGDDLIVGGNGVDTLNAGTGDDLLRGGADADVLIGAAGRDCASYWTAPAAVVADLRSPGTNTGDAAGDTYGGIEDIQGSRYDDRLAGDRIGNVLTGGPGRDLLEGRNGNDVLFGGKGPDVLVGGAGNDEMHGGRGADVFAFDPHFGHDVVSDYRPGLDRLDLRDLDFASARQAVAAFAAHGDDAVLQVGGDVLTLHGVDVRDLSPIDILV